MKITQSSVQMLIDLKRSIKIGAFVILGFLFFGLSFTAAHAVDAPPIVVVDGSEVTVEGTQAFVNGSQVPLSDLLAKLGTAPVTITNNIELFTTPPPTTTIPANGVQAIVQGNHIQLDHLTEILANHGRIGIWISGSSNGFNWRICIIISWGSVNNPTVVVDGHEVAVQGVLAQIDGQTTEFHQVVDLLKGQVATVDKIELATTTVPTTSLPADGVQAVLEGNRITFTHLAGTLARYGRISIWISGSHWRVCIIIDWNSKTDLSAVVDGHEVTIAGVKAQVDGQDAELSQVLALIGPDETPAKTVELATTGNPTQTLPADGVVAIIKDSHITLTNLTQPLAKYGRIAIWISGARWRICIIIVWGSDAALKVTVDGHEVPLGGTQAQMDGQLIDLRRILALVGDEVVTPTVVVATTAGVTLTVANAQAVLADHELALTNLAPTLAAYGRLAIWISWKNWRVCVLIDDFFSNTNLTARVDGREATIEGVEAQIDGQPTELRRVLALLNGVPTTATLELATTGVPTQSLPTTGVQAQIEGNHIKFTNLAGTLAKYGRISIWISGTRWRICIIISWGSDANLTALVDGREATVEGVEAQIDGQSTELRRVLALLNGVPTTATLELATTGVPTQSLPATGVQAQIEGNHIKFTNLAPMLAKYGRISIWISGARWRICIIISWGSDANLTALVDGREATVEGVEAQIDGQSTELRRVLALLDGKPITATKIELATTGTPTKTLPTAGVQALMDGNQIKFTNLAGTLAQYGRISIWISGARWRVCIIISWESNANLVVLIDGREVKVEGTLAQVDGQTVELRRVLALLGPNPVTASKVDLFTTPPPTQFFIADNAQAVVQGNQIKFTNLANTLASYGRLGIWISGSNWRICIIISLGTDNNPRVIVDGRPVTAYNAEAELNGAAVDPRRIFLMLGSQKVTTATVELATVGAPTQSLPATGVQAVVGDNHIELKNLSTLLAARGRISIWISGSNWRICIIIVWGKFTSADKRVDLDLPALDAHTNVDVKYTDLPTQTHPLTVTLAGLHHFRLEATDDGGLAVTQFDQAYKLEVHYTDAELAKAGINEDKLTIAYWDEKTNKWVPVPTTVDKVNNIATGTLNHFTEFIVWGEKTTTPAQSSIFLPLIR